MITLQSRPLVILGAGYTSRFLYPLARIQGWRTYATSRTPATHLTHIDREDRIEFDLMREETWNNIPQDAHLIWCFPAIPKNVVDHFIQQYAQHDGRLLFLGSTSAYGPCQHSLVDENTPVDSSLPRVESEEYFRKTYGAIILRLAGLYGPGRHVLDWIRKGKVKNTEKYVNLIHIEDVAAICLAALRKAKTGDIYVVSDGNPRQWSEIFSVASKRWGLTCPPLSPPKNSGKRLNIGKLETRLQYSFIHSDLYEAMAIIEK
ncbi:MAG: NAD-dependent epimerase/dehydratase family protein [Nitrospirales bacterium]